jgi:hypothetical protein
MVFLNQRMLAKLDESRHIWKLYGPLEDNPNDETPSTAWLHMAHVGPLPPICDLLDHQPSAETLHLLSLVEFTDLLNGCSPDALLWNAFVILHIAATARYLLLKSQELHEVLMTVHETIGLYREEKVRQRGEAPAVDASAQPVAILITAFSVQSIIIVGCAGGNANVVDSCINIIVGRPVIREHHLI